MFDLSSSTKRVHSSVDILIQMQTLLRLRYTTSSRHEDGVEEIGMTVMQLSTNVRHRPRSERTERLLLPSSDVSQNTDVLRENVLSSSNNRDRILAEFLRSFRSVRVLRRDVVVLEFTENISNLETLLQIIILIRVDELEVFSSMEDDGVVLVVRLAVSENGITGQLDSEFRSSLSVRENFGVTIDEGGEDSGLASFLARSFLVEVGDLEIGVGSEEEFGVLDFFFAEFRVSLHRDDESELASGHSLQFSLQSFRVAAEELDDLRVLDSVE